MTKFQPPERLPDISQLQLLEFLMTLPEPDPLMAVKNMHTNLNRALSCARHGEVTLTENEVIHWINGLDEFLKETAEKVNAAMNITYDKHKEQQ